MIYLIFSKRDLIRGSFAIERLEERFGYFQDRLSAEDAAAQLNSDAYEKWAAKERKHNAFAHEVRLYPELLSPWEREMLRDSYAEIPPLEVSLEAFKESSEYVEYHVVSLDSKLEAP